MSHKARRLGRLWCFHNYTAPSCQGCQSWAGWKFARGAISAQRFWIERYYSWSKRSAALLAGPLSVWRRGAGCCFRSKVAGGLHVVLASRTKHCWGLAVVNMKTTTNISNNCWCWRKNEWLLNKLWNVQTSLLLGYFAHKPTDFLLRYCRPHSLTHRLVPACIQFADATVQMARILPSNTSKIRTAAPPDVLEAAARPLLHLYVPMAVCVHAHMQACKGNASWHFSRAGMMNHWRAHLTPIKRKATGFFAWNRESSGVQWGWRVGVQWRARSRDNGSRFWWKKEKKSNTHVFWRFGSCGFEGLVLFSAAACHFCSLVKSRGPIWTKFR